MEKKNVTVARWGNSLGLRLPQAAARELGITSGVSVSIAIEGKTLTVTAAPAKPLSLASLLAQMRRRPLPKREEIDWGPPRGNEVW